MKMDFRKACCVGICRRLDLCLVVLCMSLTFVCSVTSMSTSRGQLLREQQPKKQQLASGFYSTSCPKAESIVQQALEKEYGRDRSIAPALLRMIFHDCFVQGCDASVLLNTTTANAPVEKDAPPNANSLRGFEFLETVKRKLEYICPGVVSCADVIALAARESVFLTGGPRFEMPTGRRDGTESLASKANKELPRPDEDLKTLSTRFRSKGLDENDLVTLLGAHTIGRSHCRFVRNMDRTPECRRLNDSLELDRGSGDKFDNHYYRNVREGKALLLADDALRQSDKTYSTVRTYESDVGEFHDRFARSIVKLSRIAVLTGKQGEVRRHCSFSNPGEKDES